MTSTSSAVSPSATGRRHCKVESKPMPREHSLAKCCTMLIAVTHAQETCTRNLHQIERSSIRRKCLVPETFKHSRPIKPLSCGHVQIFVTSFLSVSSLLRVQLLNRCCCLVAVATSSATFQNRCRRVFSCRLHSMVLSHASFSLSVKSQLKRSVETEKGGVQK